MKALLGMMMALLAGAATVGKDSPATAPESTASKPVIVCFGDSITAGKYPEFLAEMLPEAQVINAGVGGNTTGQGLARMEEDVLRHRPDTVLILFGTNDSVLRAAKTYRTPLKDFEENLRTMVERCREAGARPVLGTLLPIMSEPYYTRHPKEFYEPEGGLEAILERYRSKTLEVGKAMKVPVVDFYKEMTADRTMLKPDGVHPNEFGLKTIAKLFARALDGPAPSGKERE